MGELADSLRTCRASWCVPLATCVTVPMPSTAAQAKSRWVTTIFRPVPQQAASLEETAASMEELTATVKQNAENAARRAIWR